MSTLFLIAQGALTGWLANQLYPNGDPQFWITIAANSVLVVGYGFTQTR